MKSLLNITVRSLFSLFRCNCKCSCIMLILISVQKVAIATREDVYTSKITTYTQTCIKIRISELENSFDTWRLVFVSDCKQLQRFSLIILLKKHINVIFEVKWNVWRRYSTIYFHICEQEWSESNSMNVAILESFYSIRGRYVDTHQSRIEYETKLESKVIEHVTMHSDTLWVYCYGNYTKS